MPRLDIERQKRLEPKRIEQCIQTLKRLGFDVQQKGAELRFPFKGHLVYFYPYSGWFQGKSVTKGRGFRKLLTQLKSE